jgi:Rieske 2Fe-2S family protein
MHPSYLLPPSAYHEPGWFDREQASLFTNRWALVASTHDLINPGDYVTTRIGLAPVVVVRGEDGELRAFHNVCRHRGMVLLAGAGNVARAVSCFYHQWRYALDGSLVAVPQRKEQFPDLDPHEWGLLPAAVGEWEGMVFAHPDPAAPPLVDALAGIPERLGTFRPGLLTQVARERIEARCNWKLFVENHVDIYHLWYLHEQSLGDYDHRRFEYDQIGPNWASYEPLRTGAALADSALIKGTVPIAHLDEADQIGLRAQMVFPNLLIATSSEFWATYVAEPVAPDRTMIDLRVRAEANADADELVGALRSFIGEDIRACEAVQEAVASPAFRVGPLALEHERPLESFHVNVLAAVGAA